MEAENLTSLAPITETLGDDYNQLDAALDAKVNTDGMKENVKSGEENPDLGKVRAVLSALNKHQYSYIFAVPVDPIAHGCPDYFKVISKPMDLSTISKKLESGEYSSSATIEVSSVPTNKSLPSFDSAIHLAQDTITASAASSADQTVPSANPTNMDAGSSPESIATRFAEDVILMITNSLKYNPPGHSIHEAALSLSKFFEFEMNKIFPAVLIDWKEHSADAGKKKRHVKAPPKLYDPEQALASSRRKSNKSQHQSSTNDDIADYDNDDLESVPVGSPSSKKRRLTKKASESPKGKSSSKAYASGSTSALDGPVKKRARKSESTRYDFTSSGVEKSGRDQVANGYIDVEMSSLEASLASINEQIEMLESAAQGRTYNATSFKSKKATVSAPTLSPLVSKSNSPPKRQKTISSLTQQETDSEDDSLLSEDSFLDSDLDEPTKKAKPVQKKKRKYTRRKSIIGTLSAPSIVSASVSSRIGAGAGDNASAVPSTDLDNHFDTGAGTSKRGGRRSTPVEDRECEYCGTKETPMWRRGPSGKSTLCNKCGVKWRSGRILKKPDGTVLPPPSPTMLTRPLKAATKAAPAKPRKTSTGNPPGRPRKEPKPVDPTKKPRQPYGFAKRVAYDQKKHVANVLSSGQLNPQQLSHIVSLIRANMPALRDAQDEIELDIEQMDSKLVRKLFKYVTNVVGILPEATSAAAIAMGISHLTPESLMHGDFDSQPASTTEQGQQSQQAEHVDEEEEDDDDDDGADHSLGHHNDSSLGLDPSHDLSTMLGFQNFSNTQDISSSILEHVQSLAHGSSDSEDDIV